MKSPHVFCVSVVVLLLVAASPAAAQERNAVPAQQHYSRGITLFDAGRFSDALDEFRASEALFNSPNSRLFIARSLAQLGDDAAAVTAYELVIPLAEERGQSNARYLETRNAAQAELHGIEPRVGRLTLVVRDAPPGLIVHVGARQIPLDGLGVPLAFAPGTLHIRVEAPQFRTDERDVALAGGERQDVTITLQSLPPLQPAESPQPVSSPEPPPAQAVPPTSSSAAPEGRHGPARMAPSRIATIVSGGVAVAGLVTFGALAYTTNQSYEALRAQCGNRPCPASAEPALDHGRTLQTFTDISLGVGLAGLVGAAVFFALGPRIERALPGLHIAVSTNAFVIDGRF